MNNTMKIPLFQKPKETVSSIARLLELARAHAISHNYEAELGYHHCALLVHSGNIISIGYNHFYVSDIRFDPMFARRAGRLQTEAHAEISAVLGSIRRPSDSVKGSKMYVVRIGKGQNKHNLTNSRPCSICEKTLASYGIKRVFYSIDNHSFGVLNPVNLNEKLYKVG